MASNIELFLREDYLSGEAIWLEGKGFDSTPREDFEGCDANDYPLGFMISIHRDTGDPLLIVLEGFKTESEATIMALREHPLPWTFSLASMGIKEKPLEDVIYAVWKKFKNMKMNWE